MSQSLDQRLLAFAKRLHGIDEFGAMITAVVEEIREAVGYQTAWLAIFDMPTRQVRIIAVQGEKGEDVWANAPVFPLDGDPYMVRILDAIEPQIVVDAQTDPGVNREVVEALGNRTIVNVPLRLVDQPYGSLGTGSFGDEGVRVPSTEELAFLVGIAGQLVTAAARLVLARERKEAAERRAAMERRLNHRQRLESLGQLAGGVAHDFNNLLTVIMGTSDLLQLSEKDPKRKEELEIVQKAATRAAELTQRLLALGKRQRLQRRVVDVRPVVDNLVRMVRRVIPANIEIDVAGTGAPLRLNIDVAQVEQVLVNLCINARDAMRGGGTLTLGYEHVVLDDAYVGAHPWASAGDYVLLSVADTGHGMSQETLSRVFEPFFTTKESHGGSGLGLAVSLGIAEQHGGILQAQSDVGIGSTFKLYLPVAAVSEVESGYDATGEVAGGTERVLVADDEDDVRRLMERLLQRAGYEVVAVANGAEAVAMATESPFDLVILDAVMPRMGGREAFEAIRSARPDVRVMFVSGYSAEELSDRFLADTEAPLLPKPFDVETLLRAVRWALDSEPG